MNRKVSRFIDNLVYKYEFLHPIKTRPLTISALFILYFIWCIIIFVEVYNADGGIDGWFKDILPFFVDSFLIILFTSLIFFYKMTNNDEINRVNYFDSKEAHELDITTDEVVKKRLNNIREINERVINIFSEIVDCKNIIIEFHSDKYYEMPKQIEDLIKWININKDDYFRISAGSMDIPKLSLVSIEKHGTNLKLNLGITSYFNIFFTHYFADYILSNESSMEMKSFDTSLRNYLSPMLKNHYNKYKDMSKIDFQYDLPNPLGMTGIICVEYNNAFYFILKVRDSIDAAAKSKLQWSFAGTMDIFPNLYSTDFKFKDIVDDELYDEVLNYDAFNFLKEYSPRYSFIGLVTNELYLFQPEMYVCVHYKILKDIKTDEQIKLISNKKAKFISVIENKYSAGIELENLKSFIENGTIGKDKLIFEKRNLFVPGYKYLINYLEKNHG